MASPAFGHIRPVQLAARDFAVAKHYGQKRKYAEPGEEPENYVEHPKRVAMMIEEAGYGVEVVAAAYLHDVIEDCGVTREELARLFNPRIASFVNLLSNDKEPMLPRTVRKNIERVRLAGSPIEVRAIKCADLLDNGPSLLKHDPNFARVWFPEAELLLSAMGHCSLWHKAYAMVHSGLFQLGVPKL